MELDIGWFPPTILQMQQKQNAFKICFNESSFIRREDQGLNSDNVLTIESLSVSVKYPTGQVLSYNSKLYDDTEYGFDGYGYKKYVDTYIEIPLDVEGEYKIEFCLIWTVTYTAASASSAPMTNKYCGYFYVGSPDNKNIQPFTIKTVLDRTLDLTPTRTLDDKNKYTFRNNAEEYGTEESPEFTFTGKHLFEAMLDVSSYKKMFPAIEKDEIFFRPFWNGIILSDNDLPAPLKVISNSAIDQYCMALDSYVENVVCVNDTNIGTVIEPYKNGYISTRSNSGSAIKEDTCIIPTQSEIYRSLILEVGKVNGVDVGDVQAYVYEQEDYDALSDTSAAYPYSKAFAIKYNRFQKNYTEIAHRISVASEMADAFERPALGNILNSKTGGKTGDVGVNLATYLSNLLGLNYGSSFADLLFRPNYIPIVNARVRQYKPLLNDEDYDATLFYNQQSEVVDSEAFGEHIKGMVQKLGNHTEIRVYRFARIDDVPTVGTIIDDKSVYNVAMTIYENHVDATICLVDYAELSTYIGVKNEIKTSDISTTKWSNRFINWEEFLVFTHDDSQGNALSITAKALADIVSFVKDDALTCAEFTTYTVDDVKIITAFAPIKHLALGNSIYFQWEMLDNFAVGYQSEKAPDGATNTLTGTKYDRAQRAVRYCDIYGRAETMDFKLLKDGPTPNNSRLQGYTNDDAYILHLAHQYPEKPEGLEFDEVPIFELKDLLIKKNSAEALKFAAQYHFRQTWKEFVIGSGMSNFCSLIGGKCLELEFYVSSDLLNKFDRHIAWQNGKYRKVSDLPTFIVDESKERVEIKLPEDINGQSINSWCLVGVDKNNNRQLIFGENKNIQKDRFETTIYLVPRRKR